MSQYLYVQSCMCAIITLEIPNLLMDAFDERQILVLAAVSLLPAEIFVTKITLVLLISRRQLNGRQRGTQEMAAVRKWLL